MTNGFKKSDEDYQRKLDEERRAFEEYRRRNPEQTRRRHFGGFSLRGLFSDFHMNDSGGIFKIIAMLGVAVGAAFALAAAWKWLVGIAVVCAIVWFIAEAVD